MTLTQIEADVYRRLSFGTSPATAVTTRIRSFINETQREICRKRTLSRVRRTPQPIAFTTIADSPYIALPRAATRIYSIVDRTNDRPLDEASPSELDDLDPGRDVTSSTGERFAVVNYNSAVARQPSDSSQLLIDSTAAGDTGTAYIEVVDANGEQRTASVTMTGTTAVNLGPSNSLLVTDLYTSAVAVGTITLVEDSEGGTELARIGIGKSRAHYTLLRIWPTPSSAYTLYVDCDLAIIDMANANDEPIIAEDFHYLLSIGARMKEYEFKEKWAAYDKLRAGEWSKGVAELELEMHRLSAATIDGQSRGRSQLGPYYPPGS